MYIYYPMIGNIIILNNKTDELKRWRPKLPLKRKNIDNFKNI